jgi:HEAT repeat protein
VEALNATILPWQESLRHEWLEKSAATQRDRHEEVRQEVSVLFAAATDQYFEDGMESAFSRALIALIEEYGETALKAVTHLILSQIANEEVAAEALRRLGRMDHAPTYTARLWLLERSLFCFSPAVRDGAALGLAAMDDPQAITSLEQAIHGEKNAALREDLTQVLTQLRTSAACR